MATPPFMLIQLARQAAAQLGFTVHHWWRERIEAAMLRMEVERRLVSAPRPSRS